MEHIKVKGATEIKKCSDVIIDNRVGSEIDDVIDNVYTRDLFKRD